MAPTLSPTCTVRRLGALDFTHLGEEAVAIDLERNACFALNRTGLRIWEELASPLTPEALSLRLAQAYGIDAGLCLREVMELLRGLQGAGLVEACDAPLA